MTMVWSEKEQCFMYNKYDTFFLTHDKMCEHNKAYAACNKCNGKTASVDAGEWLLDSGASWHLTSDLLLLDNVCTVEFMSVKMANGTVFIDKVGDTTLHYHHHSRQMRDYKLHDVHTPIIHQNSMKCTLFDA